MHPLQNGSQVTEAPAKKNPIGDQGYFTESGENGAPSYPGADWFNANIKEFMNALAAAGVEFDPDRFDHLARMTSAPRNQLLRSLLGKPVHESIVGRTQDGDLIAPAVGQKLYVSDYQTAYEIISQADNFIDEATKAADPFQYAGYWGFGNDGADFFTTPNLSLTMHLKSAGVYGNAGESKEDHLQNITGSLGQFAGQSSIVCGDGKGAFADLDEILYGQSGYPSSVVITTDAIDGVSFDASRVARTDTFTDSMGTFFDPYIWLPKGVF